MEKAIKNSIDQSKQNFRGNCASGVQKLKREANAHFESRFQNPESQVTLQMPQNRCTK